MNNSLSKENQKIILQNILSECSICDFCIGRLYDNGKTIFDYKKLGKELRTTLTDINEVEDKNCNLCDGILLDIDHLIKLIKSSLDGYDFSSFILGFHVDRNILEKEEKILENIKSIKNESLKMFLKKIIGICLEKDLGKPVSFDDPDIMIIVNTMFQTVSLQIKSLYVYGRYNKFKRGVPQTKWFCRQCSGIGCRRCDYTGSLFDSSVEEYIGPIFIEAFKGENWSFHGSGREDIDVKMLGSGRPFILEIHNPRKRIFDLHKIEHKINEAFGEIIRISELSFTEKEDIARIKESAFNKVYEISFEAEKPFDTEKLKKVALTLRGTIIQQYTPTRVARRRANKVRPRKIYNCSIVSVMDTRARFRIESASGTYIKELVTGDNGRTKPSISELIGQPCQVISLDVMEIKGD